MQLIRSRSNLKVMQSEQNVGNRSSSNRLAAAGQVQARSSSCEDGVRLLGDNSGGDDGGRSDDDEFVVFQDFRP